MYECLQYAARRPVYQLVQGEPAQPPRTSHSAGAKYRLQMKSVQSIPNDELDAALFCLAHLSTLKSWNGDTGMTRIWHVLVLRGRRISTRPVKWQ